MTAAAQRTGDALAEEVAKYYADPLGFVLFAFPWGEGSLKGFDGPDTWAREFLEDLGQQVRDRAFNGIDAVDPIMFSTASGHGIGKSAMVAWLVNWIMSTRPHSKGTITANTAQQLRSKTFSEIGKWWNLSITKDWFEFNGGSMGSLNMYAKASPLTWRCDGQTSEERNSEAFAGQHAANSTSFYIFDEASAIPDKVFEVRAGGLSDGEPMAFDFGNPTRNTGRFYENMVGRFRHRYTRRFIDSRDVKITNKKQFQEWIDDFGIDSDYVKVRVLGQFPSAGDMQFIPGDVARACVGLEVVVQPHDPLVMGVDVARFGSDESVIYLRQGRDAESQGLHRFRGIDTMQLSAKVAEIAADKRPDAIFIDGGGVGGGVVDRCRQLGLNITEINFGGKATQPGVANLRAQMWYNLREALKDGIRLPDNDDLISDLTGLEYGYTLRNDIKLESKDDALKRGISSPDLADALALTYALPVYPSRLGYDNSAANTQYEYDPFGA